MNRGNKVGAVALILVIASWALLELSSSIMPPGWVPTVYLFTLILSGPVTIVLGIIAGRKASRWWYFVAVAGALSAAILLAGVAD